jgi:hypothetical protein
MQSLHLRASPCQVAGPSRPASSAALPAAPAVSRTAAPRSHGASGRAAAPLIAHRQARILMKAVRADAPASELDGATIQLLADIAKVAEDKVAATVAANNAVAKAPQGPNTSELRSKIVKAINQLKAGLLEREAEVRLPTSWPSSRIACEILVGRGHRALPSSLGAHLPAGAPDASRDAVRRAPAAARPAR